MIVLVKSSNLSHVIENSNYDYYIQESDYLKLDNENMDKEYVVDSNNKVYLLSYGEIKDV